MLLRTKYLQELLKNLGGENSNFFQVRFFLKPPKERSIWKLGWKEESLLKVWVTTISPNFLRKSKGLYAYVFYQLIEKKV